MRIALFLGLLFLALPLQAGELSDAVEKTQTCLIEKTETTDGKNYTSCEAEPHNDALLEKGFVAARIERNTQKGKQPVWVHGICRYIDNRSQAQDYFVPFKTADEWKSFLKNLPATVVTGGCCEPRPLAAADIITPAQSCAGGWLLQGVVNATDLSTMVMQVQSDGSFTGADGEKIDLPLLRDDENAVFEYNGMKEFAARFVCADGKATGFPVADHPEEGITYGGGMPAANPGETGHIPFMARCWKRTWRVISVRPCTETEHTHTESCEAYGFPPGTEGEVTVRTRYTCPDNVPVEDVAGNTCGKKPVKPE